MEYEESGVVAVANDKQDGKFQSIAFRGRDVDGKAEWFSNWNKDKLKVGDVVNFNYTEKGQYKNIKEFEIVNKSETKEEPESKQAPVRNPEPDIGTAADLKDKETSEIKSKIKEIVIARGQTVQFKEFEPTKFFVSMTAEYNPEDNHERVCAIMTDMADTEIRRQILNELERRKENGN